MTGFLVYDILWKPKSELLTKSAPASPSVPPTSADTEVTNAGTRPSLSVAASVSDSFSLVVGNAKRSPFRNEVTRTFDANALHDDIRAHHNASVSVV
ncbi:hypothetical protein BC830DRAFT_1174487 [Chytriomyces sp. MP71]|nr:hypothetical protein BC830DRAFT_1174487 [Chytriomyces sp. MP71]